MVHVSRSLLDIRSADDFCSESFSNKVLDETYLSC
jgi:hypothetical protein